MSRNIVSTFTRLALGSAATALTFALAGCGDNPPPVSQAVLQAMHDKPTGSYTLIPVTKKASTDTQPEYTGKFTAVIKENEIINPQAVNEAGKPGTLKCSTYSATPLRLNALGELTARYSSGSRYCSTEHNLIIKPENGKMHIPANSGYAGCYAGKEPLNAYDNVNYCSFTPAVTP